MAPCKRRSREKPGENNQGPISAARTSVLAARSSCALGLAVFALCLAGEAQSNPPSSTAAVSASMPDAPARPADQAAVATPIHPLTQSEQERAAEQVRQQEKQRIAGVVPNFNVSYNEDAPPLSPKQKLQIALRTMTDPVAFGIAGSMLVLARRRTTSLGMGREHKAMPSDLGLLTPTTSTAPC